MLDESMTDRTPEPLFDRVVCAVDGSAVSAEAARQADVLTPPGRSLELVTVITEAELEGGWGGYRLSPGSWRERVDPALQALSKARPVEMGPIDRAGPVDVALVDELTEREATLVVVGRSRRAALPPFLNAALHASVTARLAHDAPCSLLIARLDEDLPRSFHAIAVGVDGSEPAAAACRAAEALASRLNADLTLIAADGAAPPGDVAAPVVQDSRSALEALCEADADLLVVGSRGVHGMRALGSVSERVAERSNASVLIVRG